MRKTILAASFVTVALALPGLALAQAAAPAPAPAPAAAPTPPWTFTGNMSLVSDYRFRGITKTFGKAAMQGDAQAQFNLALSYWLGRGGKKDDKTAIG
jgi:TPR repeat protein